MQTKVIFDTETNGFYEDVDTLHCIALKRIGIDEDVLLFDPSNLDEALDILSSADQLIGHNIIQYDISEYSTLEFYLTCILSREQFEEIMLQCLETFQRILRIITGEMSTMMPAE